MISSLVVTCAALLATAPPAPADSALPNDNRTPAGRASGGVLRLSLEARRAAWRPDPAVDSLVTVYAFAETGRPARIPGPLVRASEGAEVEVTLRNALDSALTVRGMRGGAFATDTLHLAPGATRTVRFRAGAPGTYVYWGTTTGSPVGDRPWRDSQLTGALVIDPRGARPDPRERIFVMTVLDIYKSDTVRNRKGEDVWEVAINGRSWPHTERLEYAVGDTVRWRWVNGSYLPHPMHLHGFHFRVTAKGEGNVDSTYAPGAARLAVTETMLSGSTFRMDWVPTRAGHWLVHCHMLPHITPFPERPDSLRHHGSHDPSAHPLAAMAGLVLGVTTVERGARRAAASAAFRPPPLPASTQRLRVFAQQARPAETARPAPGGARRPVPRGYVLQRGAEPAADSVEVTSPPLVLTRGRTAAITVINRLGEPTTVHWHGMELESVYDGVSGWSRSGRSVAPLLAPGDSFTAVLTPPRAGTYMYHTHIDEGPQLVTGLYGPLIVLEPGERWDPATDLVMMLGEGVMPDSARPQPMLNGRRRPPPLELRVGTTYRLRLASILPADPATVALVAADSQPVTWRPRAKDGADLPPGARAERPARLRVLGVGETYDFEWTPTREMDAELVVRIAPLWHEVRQPVRVRR